MIPLAHVAVAASALLLAPATPSDADLTCTTPAARAFDFWIGEWDVVNRQSPPGSPRWFTTGTATDRVYAAVGGCAVVEHWRGHTFQGEVSGFSVRAWNEQAGTWDLVLLWPAPGQPRFGELHGTFRHGRGDFFTTSVSAAGDTTRTRFTFADVTPSTLRWQDGTSTDGGVTWGSSWIMEFTRRGPLAAGLWNGPTMTLDRCPDDVHRAFDDHLGTWTGERRGPDGEPHDVLVQTIRIVEGCATLQSARATDGSWASLTVRGYEPAADRWVRWTISTDAPVLRRWEAPGSPKPATWSREGGRITELDADAGWGWRTELRAGEASWAPAEEVRVTERIGG